MPVDVVTSIEIVQETVTLRRRPRVESRVRVASTR